MIRIVILTSVEQAHCIPEFFKKSVSEILQIKFALTAIHQKFFRLTKR